MANKQSGSEKSERESTSMARAGGEQRGMARSQSQYQDPLSLIDSLFERMQRDFFGTTLFNAMLPNRGAGDSGETARVPRLSMRDTGESIELTAELPGIKPENVSVELEGDVLTIRGEAEEHEERGDERMEHRACFYRQLALPEGVDPEQVHAAYENGRLTIQLPKRADRSNARQIPITTQQQGQPGGEPARQTKEKAA